MSFNTSLSGLNAASKDLSVTSNNIANVNSTGFKKSRAEFGDVYAVSAFGNSKTAVGAGILTQSVSQQFNQGNLEFTDNSLDLAVSGNGFFAMAPNLTSQDLVYTRAGGLSVNKDGYVVNSSGQYLMTLPVNPDGSVSSTSLSTATPLLLPTASGIPRATTEIELGVNVPADAPDLVVADFDPSQPQTYTNATSVTVFDSLGESHIVTNYFVKAGANQWAIFQSLDGNPVDINAEAGTSNLGHEFATMTFNNDGTFAATIPASIDSEAVAFSNGANPMTYTLDLKNNAPTQFANQGFTVNELSQDGATTGRLSGLSIGEDGLVRANYTNGDTEALGKILLADFKNVNGLKQVGNNAWQQTLDSGEPLVGEAGTGRFGLVQSGALETSNVDLTEQLVNLITAQRNFQANAKAIETNKAISDTIINIR